MKGYTMAYTIKNKGLGLLLAAGVALALITPVSAAKGNRRGEGYAGAKSKAPVVVTFGCVIESYGCTPNAGEVVTLTDDGAGTLNGVSACFLPSYGCKDDRRVSMFGDGSVIIYSGPVR